MPRPRRKAAPNDFVEGEAPPSPPSASTAKPQPYSQFSKNAKRPGHGTKKGPVTHFLCIPLITSSSRPQLEASLQRFRDEVAEGVAGEGVNVPEKAVRPIGTLHLTLGVMSLMGEEKVQEAVGLLEGLELGRLLEAAKGVGEGEDEAVSQPNPEPQTEPEKGVELAAENPSPLEASADGGVPIPPPATPPLAPLTLSLTSLHSMHTPTKTSILYAVPSDSSKRLYPLCVSLQKLFTEHGFLLPDDRPLKLHATIVNTIYAKAGGRGGTGGRGRGPRGRGGMGRADGGAGREMVARAAEEGVGAGAGAGAGNGVEAEAIPDRSHGHGPNSRAPIRFDARELLARYEDFVWAADVRVEKVAICRMGAKKILDEGGMVVGEEYEEVASVKFG